MTFPYSWIIIYLSPITVTYYKNCTTILGKRETRKSLINTAKANLPARARELLNDDIQNVWHNWEDAE